MVYLTKLVFCFIISIWFANAEHSITVGNDVIDSLKEKTAQCYEESGGDIEIFQRIPQWQFGDDEISKKFYYCLFKNTGYIKETGHVNNENFLALFDKSGKKDIANDAVIECNKINASDPVETSYKFILCFAEKSSLKLVAKLDK